MSMKQQCPGPEIMGRYDKSPMPLVGHGARFAVVQGHPRGPRFGSFKSPCRTSYWSSTEIIALNCLSFRKTTFLDVCKNHVFKCMHFT